MVEYTLSVNNGLHDPSAAIFENGELVFGVEEERFTRQKHASSTFPHQSIEACLRHCGVSLSDVDRVLIPYDPSLASSPRLVARDVKNAVTSNRSFTGKVFKLTQALSFHFNVNFGRGYGVRHSLREIGTPVPPLEFRSHHRCHAASAFHLSSFDRAVAVTVDGQGEHDSTVVWSCTPEGLERVRTYERPNSLGHFYGTITEYLGYEDCNGEGKVMGLAPYGRDNESIRRALRSLVDVGADYDVTGVTFGGRRSGIRLLEERFDRERVREPGGFDQWHRDLAHETQRILEEVVAAIVTRYCRREGASSVCLAGGVALNCKMNKRIMELDAVDDVFVQPVAHDAGLPIGAGLLDQSPTEVDPMSTVYLGPSYDDDRIRAALDEAKVPYREPDDLHRVVAERIADGALVGWFQGRMEMGPRALGNRSILADPRSAASRDRINEFVKHRESWRPFAPSMLAAAADAYLQDAADAPYMIKSFDVKPARGEEIAAVLHPEDDTTRPQLVAESANPSFHRLLSEFENVTGVPVLLNTSFNDHAEPIVNTPGEALKDFFGMGLDLLVLGDYLVSKPEAA